MITTNPQAVTPIGWSRRRERIFPLELESSHGQFHSLLSSPSFLSSETCSTPAVVNDFANFYVRWTYHHLTINSPGRFFASTQVKAFIAHLIYHYDIKWANDANGVPRPPGWRPENVWFGTNCAPNPNAEICIRRRELWNAAMTQPNNSARLEVKRMELQAPNDDRYRTNEDDRLQTLLFYDTHSC